MGRPHYYWSNDTPSNTSFPPNSFSGLLTILFVCIVLVYLFLSKIAGFKAFSIVRPLQGEKYEILIEDGLDVLSSQEEDRLYQVFEEFQRKTGITPAFISAQNAEWKGFYSSMEKYAYDLYVNQFFG